MHQLLRKWWPGKVDRAAWEPKLSDFYTHNEAYHAMTAGGDKSTHPQVKYLLERVQPGECYAEIGCGGGLVSGLVSQAGAKVQGFDVSPIAIANATAAYGSPDASFTVNKAEVLPLTDSVLDGVWSFEMLEHVWDPVAVLREMVRVVKLGGFVFVTCPNHFSLDLHLSKKRVIRMAEMGCALVRYVQDKYGSRYFVNIEPNILREDVYPDCDMVSSLIPCRIPALARELGCQVERLSMYKMCAEHVTNPRPELLRYDRWPLARWFGDHVLLWMVKEM